MAILKLKNKTTGEWEEIQAIIGNGISSIEKTSTSGLVDTYTITYTNGNTTTFDVSNGEVTREELEEEVERLSMIYNAFPTTTGEGEEPSINGTAEVPFKEIGLKGNTYQDSTTGKNLIGLVEGTTTHNGITATTSNGEITLNGTATANSFVDVQLVDNYSLTNGEKYTISLNNSEANSNVSLRITGTGTYDTIANSVNRTNTITYDSSVVIFGKKITIRTNSGTTLTNYKIKPQIEKGETSTSYENFTYGASPNPSYPQEIHVVTGDNEVIVSSGDNTQSQTYPINLGSMELCKIGNYQDYLYKDSGKWYLNKQIGKVVLDGSENWYRWSANTFYITKLTEIRNALSNYYTYNPTATGGGQLSNGEFFIHDSTNNNTVIFKNTGINDSIDSFKTWLSTHNVILYYALATPTITEITDTTLIEQLDNLEKAYSYDTQTNISQTNQDKPFIISYEAILSLRNVLNSLETRIAVLETE